MESDKVQQRQSSGLDTRTVIALALMVAVWVIFTQYMSPKRKPAPPGAAATTETSVPAAAPAPGAAPAVAGPGARALHNAIPAEDGEVTVEGAHYRAVFGTRGASLRSWTLKDYTDAAGRPVELVPAGARGAMDLRIDSPEGVIDLGATVFSLEQTDEGPVRVLRFVAEGPLVSGAADTAAALVRVVRIFRVDPARYDIGMEIAVTGVANPRLDHHLVVGWETGIPDQEANPRAERPYKAADALFGRELIKDGFGGGRGVGCSCSGGKAARGGERTYEGMLQWACVRGKYFTGLLVPEQEVEATMIADSDPVRGIVGMRLLLPLADEGTTRQRFTVYCGPIDYARLKELDAQVHREVTRVVDFGGKWIAPISKATQWFLTTVHSVVPNYGIVILLLAVFVRVIFHPLTVKSLRSQRKLQMLKPELDRVNAEYKDNAELRTKKIMELHKQHGVNPVGGCLPLLVQMPVIWALYNVLMNSIELRKAPFVFWVRDLAAPDTIGRIAGVPINPLPVLMALTMFWQQKLTPTDPRQAPMLIMMPILMTFFFYGLPSGLVFYWTVTNLLAIAQQMTMKPLPELAFAGTTAPAPDAGQGSRRGKRSEK
jgi:YidC/Oxa1 family membrane protein insertase